MHRIKRSNDAVHWFMSDLSSRIVAESGKPSDRFHLGKLILQSFKDAPEFLMQIDGATGQSETNASALARSVRCATGLKNLGLQYGDVMVLMAPNHIDLGIPLYAALYQGITIAALDMTMTVSEIKDNFNAQKPKIIFCQSEKAADIQLALDDLELHARIITFDKGDNLCSFDVFLEKYGDDTSVDEFRPAEFDPAETAAFLMATSGTTGIPKAAVGTHKNFVVTGPYYWEQFTEFPTPTRMMLVLAPLHWFTALYNFVFSPIMRCTRLQSSSNVNPDHAYQLINTYKPTFTAMNPIVLNKLIKLDNSNQCDFSCFDMIYLGGSAVPQELIQEVKRLSPATEMYNAYGMSELTGLGFRLDHPAPGSSGKPLGCLQYRIVDMDTQEDITEPNIQGELWAKGPGIIKEYDNPAATKEAFTEDRWFKTGDIFYRDEHWNFFFVERQKLLLKYYDPLAFPRCGKISPVELEGVIRQHPGVLDVAVTGIPDPAYGDLAVACVVRRPGSEVTADAIKDLVKETLSDMKRLRGGVIFVNELPVTASSKVNRRELKELALHMARE